MSELLMIKVSLKSARVLFSFPLYCNIQSTVSKGRRQDIMRTLKVYLIPRSTDGQVGCRECNHQSKDVLQQ